MTLEEELRHAAAKLRTLAAAATPGPWCFYDHGLWRGTAEALAAFDAVALTPGPSDPDEADALWPYGIGENGHLFHGDPVLSEDAALIATMDPDLAAALADWLDAAAPALFPNTFAVVVARQVNGGVL